MSPKYPLQNGKCVWLGTRTSGGGHRGHTPIGSVPMSPLRCGFFCPLCPSWEKKKKRRKREEKDPFILSVGTVLPTPSWRAILDT